jgi:phage tail sheath protein FI
MVGLGSTMTKADIEKGLMIVSLNVAPESPAEFTTLTVQQKMPVTPLPAVALSSNAH